eukprot:gene11399-3404_t
MTRWDNKAATGALSSSYAWQTASVFEILFVVSDARVQCELEE